MIDQKFQLQDVIDNLSRTPKVLRSMLEGLPQEWIHNNEGENTWSAYDVVGHLIHGEKTDWMTRIQTILDYGDTKEFEPFDRQAHLKANHHKSLDLLLDEFETIRQENIKLLSALVTENDLDRKGQHPDFGSVTLQELLATWMVHDFNHIGQISRVLAKYCQDEVGPWKAYLGILQPRK
ncbi:DinB family protein [Shimazuella sp. AN120528]|uniref:DinB family protein n=1 Tax=Shimazuella soli TaxID=1892854 RepID=UPI001F0E2EF7|nr:DinB family protein [Shimazuella soli]